jgi:hypothetical protein
VPLDGGSAGALPRSSRAIDVANRREADITDRLEYVAVGPQAPTLVGFDDSPIALATNTVGA